MAVGTIHNGSGTLDLYVCGSGPLLLTIAGSGKVNVYLKDCTGLVTINLIGSETVTIYVPTGESPPQITGRGSYIILYYKHEDEKDEKASNG